MNRFLLPAPTGFPGRASARSGLSISGVAHFASVPATVVEIKPIEPGAPREFDRSPFKQLRVPAAGAPRVATKLSALDAAWHPSGGCGMSVQILHGDCRDVLKTMPDASVHCCVTSPPYFGLRDYGNAAQIGLEPTPAEYVGQMVEVFREVRRVLRDDGTLWLNLGDSYAGGGGHSPNAPSSATSKSGRYGDALKSGGIKPHGAIKAKDLIGIPWRVAFALQADGWYLRQDIIWSKPNPMPESVRDRCTKAHEYVFLLSKSQRYFYDIDSMQETAAGPAKVCGQKNDASRKDAATTGTVRGDGETRNKRSVWTIATQPFSEAHFATMAPELAETCIKAGCPEGGTVLDPFGGAGTTGLVADRMQRSAVLIELNPAYAALASGRITGDSPLFSEVTA